MSDNPAKGFCRTHSRSQPPAVFLSRRRNAAPAHPCRFVPDLLRILFCLSFPVCCLLRSCGTLPAWIFLCTFSDPRYCYNISKLLKTAPRVTGRTLIINSYDQPSPMPMFRTSAGVLSTMYLYVFSSLEYFCPL